VKRHQQEQAEIINDALTPGAISQTRKCAWWRGGRSKVG
jgi:hypothetical protein